MRFLEVVALEGNIPLEKWQKLAEEVKKFCSLQHITIVRQKVDSQGIEFAVDIDHGAKVRTYIYARLLKKI